MKKELVVIAALSLFAMTTQPVFAWCKGDCDDDKEKSPPINVAPVNLNLLSNNLAVDTSVDTTAKAKAVAKGGEGGAGGTASASLTASTGEMSTNVKIGDTKTGDSNSTASTDNVGNGNGATVSYANYIPVQVAPLPPTIVTGNLHLEKIGDCGRRFNVESFKREMYVPQGFGLWNKSVPVQTMQGTIKGFAEEPFIVDTVTLPEPFSKKIVTFYGHQLYLAVGNDGQGGGSSGAANYANGRAMGAGASLSANSAYGVVGMVAVDCVYDHREALGELNTVKTNVLASTGRQVLVKKSTKQTLCNGKPIPEGYGCAFVRDRVKVVKDVSLGTVIP